MKKSHLKKALTLTGLALVSGVLAMGINAAMGAEPVVNPPGTGVAPTFTGLTVNGASTLNGNTKVGSGSLVVGNPAVNTAGAGDLVVMGDIVATSIGSLLLEAALIVNSDLDINYDANIDGSLTVDQIQTSAGTFNLNSTNMARIQADAIELLGGGIATIAADSIDLITSNLNVSTPAGQPISLFEVFQDAYNGAYISGGGSLNLYKSGGLSLSLLPNTMTANGPGAFTFGPNGKTYTFGGPVTATRFGTTSRVNSSVTSIAPLSTVTTTSVACPTGSYLLSCGDWSNNMANVNVSSYPSGNACFQTAYNQSGTTSYNFVLYGICLNPTL